MEEKKENSKTRFLEFLNKIGISQYKCAQMCGWASGYLTGLKGDFGADKLATIMSVFPQLNIMWIINGQGDMFSPDAKGEEKTPEIQKENGSTIPFEVFMQTTENYNKIIAEKNAEIDALRQKLNSK
ncbi:hypothetical protein DW169_21205 [Bacteroides intestinalis]|uniref:hypothetical protein n=1 Tax=Bacteroides intestinalis TaxID=329854 RepID=UPI000E4993DB|nr:hypothetical protein [Bacteroides intestinalis]RHI27384.1 hypothetical protein DW169_21205 [Bacteroides intestinalis]